MHGRFSKFTTPGGTTLYLGPINNARLRDNYIGQNFKKANTRKFHNCLIYFLKIINAESVFEIPGTTKTCSMEDFQSLPPLVVLCCIWDQLIMQG